MFKKSLLIVYGKSFLTLWLIFLNSCVSIYPIKISFFHNLSKVDSNIYWDKDNQSLLYIEEEIILYFFNYKNQSQKNRDVKIIKDPSIHCKDKNDILVNEFLLLIKKNQEHINQNKIREFENYLFWLLKHCQDYYIKENINNMFYWFSLNEEYSH